MKNAEVTDDINYAGHKCQNEGGNDFRKMVPQKVCGKHARMSSSARVKAVVSGRAANHLIRIIYGGSMEAGQKRT